MKKDGVPLTRKNYLNIAYMGDTPNLDAEGEAMLPKWAQKRPKRKTMKKERT
jgi:hypothetical protein